MTKEYVKQRSNCPVERFANAILAMTALHDMNIEELKGESFCAYLLDVKARSQITRLTGPAPVMLGMPPSRNRGVRCSRFVGLFFIRWLIGALS